MTNDLNEKLKIVAEYFGGTIYPVWKVNGIDRFAWTGDCVSGLRAKSYLPRANSILLEHLEFHASYDWQIPVWQKLCKQHLDMNDKCTDDIKQFMLLKEQYCKAISYGTPLDSFKILVQAIKFINQLKK